MENHKKIRKNKYDGKLFVVCADQINEAPTDQIDEVPAWLLDSNNEAKLWHMTDFFIKTGTIGLIVDAADLDYAKVLVGEYALYMHWRNIKLSS